MHSLRRATTTRGRPPPPPPSALWQRHRAWAISRCRHRRRQRQQDDKSGGAVAVAVAAPAAPADAEPPAASSSPAARRPPPPWTEPTPPKPNAWDDHDQKQPLSYSEEEEDPAQRRAALRELLGGLRDDAALAALFGGAADFTRPALAATLDALGAVLGLERRHLLRVVSLAPELLTDPSRARRVVAALGRVLGAPRPTDVAAYGRAFPPLFALAPDDDDDDDDDDEEEEDEMDDEENGEEEAGLRGRIRALARLLVVGPVSSSAAAAAERAFRAWAREYPPRAAALLAQPAAEVAAKAARLEAALGPSAGGAEAATEAATTASARAAARLLALARPMLLDVGAVVLRSRVVALAAAGRVDVPALAALAVSAGGEGRVVPTPLSASASPAPPPPLVPLGVQGLAELLMCAPQRLSEWAEALSAMLLLLPPPDDDDNGGDDSPPPQASLSNKTKTTGDALPLAAAASHPLGARAFALETLLLLGARNPSDAIARWRTLQTAVWRRDAGVLAGEEEQAGGGGSVASWREEVETTWGAQEVAAALSARHDQLARVSFLAASVSGGNNSAAREVGLMEAIRGTTDFDRRFPSLRKWLVDGGA